MGQLEEGCSLPTTSSKEKAKIRLIITYRKSTKRMLLDLPLQHLPNEIEIDEDDDDSIITKVIKDHEVEEKPKDKKRKRHGAEKKKKKQQSNTKTKDKYENDDGENDGTIAIEDNEKEDGEQSVVE